jgi:holo-[acyl-carrier protein] synthase
VIVGIGMDVVEVARVSRLLGNTWAGRFLARCFTPREQEYCDAFGDRARRYAARFAAKEAVAKALGAPPGIRWTDIEVERAEGAPRVRLWGGAERAARERGVVAVHLTLTHDAGIAAATVVLEGGQQV